jgi:hypothetical protein
MVARVRAAQENGQRILLETIWFSLVGLFSQYLFLATVLPIATHAAYLALDNLVIQQNLSILYRPTLEDEGACKGTVRYMPQVVCCGS